MGYDRSFGAGGGIGFRDSPGPGPTRVEVGKEYEVEVTEISRKGDGVAKVHGFVVFVKEEIVGRKDKVKIDQVESRFAIGTVVS